MQPSNTYAEMEKEQTKLTHIKKVDELKLPGLPTMTALLRHKRLRWVGHPLRRDDGQLSQTEVYSELALSSKPLKRCVLSDVETIKVQLITKKLGTESQKREHFNNYVETAWASKFPVKE